MIDMPLARPAIGRDMRSRVVWRMVTGALAAVALAAGLGGCASTEIPLIYRVEVQQGNVLDDVMLAQLEPGMDQRRVSFILGTPLITDPFNADRWDYYYSLRRGIGRRDQRIVTLLFDQGQLKRIVGDVQPGTAGRLATAPPDQVVDVPPAEPEGFFAALTPNFLKSDESKRRARSQERLREIQAEEEARQGSSAAEQASGVGQEQEPKAAEDAPAQAAARTPAGAAADTRYFNELFGGYGRAPQAAAAALPALPDVQDGAESADAGDTGSPPASDEDETFFQRLARKFKEDQKAAAERGVVEREAGDQ